jgi:hypothetical protein
VGQGFTKELDMKTALHLLVTALFATGASAQSFVYPAKGQSPQQQKQDEGQCHGWAVQQSKYDPANPPPAQAAQGPGTPTGTTPGAGARGAVRGAVLAEAVGGEADRGAAAGAVAARSRSRRQNAAQAEQASQQQNQAGLSAYQRARAACLEGRGYTVK